MKLATFTPKRSARSLLGILENDTVYGTALSTDVRGVIERGIRPTISRTESYPVGEVNFRAPLIPRKIIGIGRNYAAHAEELDNEVPGEPLLFAVFSTAIVGYGDVVTWSSELTTQVDYEGELAVIIGKRARNISEEQAMDHVFGYTIANDVSARDLQDNDAQWVRAKGLDTFCPIGPVIVTKDEIPDPHNLTITTTINGEERQNANTGLMIFKIPHLIAYISRAITLEPGDIIMTGTPNGVGKASGQFLQDGDTMTVSISGIGELTNTCKVL